MPPPEGVEGSTWCFGGKNVIVEGKRGKYVTGLGEWMKEEGQEEKMARLAPITGGCGVSGECWGVGRRDDLMRCALRLVT